MNGYDESARDAGRWGDPGMGATDSGTERFQDRADSNAGHGGSNDAGSAESQRWDSDGKAEAGQFQGLLNGVAALVSVGLVVGVVVWGAGLVIRDVSGIPVVRAIDGPMRVAPEEPGGEVARHQGLSVNEVVANSPAPDIADGLVLAPEQVGLAHEDRPMAELARMGDTVSGRGSVPEIYPTGANPRIASPENGALDDARPTQRLPRVTLVTPTAYRALPDNTPQREAIPDNVSARIPEPPGAAWRDVAATDARVAVPAVQVRQIPTLRPQARPSQAVRVAVPEAIGPVRTESAADTTDTIRTAFATQSAQQVQLGAMRTRDLARKEWSRLRSRLGEILVGREQLIVEGVSGGRPIYRLRVPGFADLEVARRFCATIKGRGLDCIVVPPR